MAYDYIERTYRRKYAPGQRVTLDELGGIDGVVLRVQGDPHYVRVQFARNGKVQSGDFHPTSITVVA